MFLWTGNIINSFFLLSKANYDKSKFIFIGKEKFRKSTLETFEKDPLQMGGDKIEHSEQEQHLGGVIHEKGCKESINRW